MHEHASTCAVQQSVAVLVCDYEPSYWYPLRPSPRLDFVPVLALNKKSMLAQRLSHPVQRVRRSL